MDKDNDEQTTVAVLDMEEANITEQEYSDSDIQGMIYKIRGQQVMLDSDLAKLYGYTVKRLNEQVKRNKERFPDDFMFELSKEEIDFVRSQIATSRNGSLFKGQDGGRRYAPKAFTEQGVYMLATVLKGEVAVNQSVMIMRTFKKMRHYLIENKQLLGNDKILEITHTLIDDNIKIKEEINKIKDNVDNMVTKNDMQITMSSVFDNFISKDSLKEFVFKNSQPFEANVAYINIYKEAKQSIYIIDDYINCHTLSLLTAKNDGVDVTIFSDNKGRGSGKLNQLEFNNFNTEYPTLSIKKNDGKCHDRFIILDYNTDNEKIYHCGASSKDAGKKVCCISLFSTSEVIHSIIDELLTHEDLELS
ncbi:MAG: ORF6N domain-containing protein [Longibaculum sp.]